MFTTLMYTAWVLTYPICVPVDAGTFIGLYLVTEKTENFDSFRACSAALVKKQLTLPSIGNWSCESRMKLAIIATPAK